MLFYCRSYNNNKKRFIEIYENRIYIYRSVIITRYINTSVLRGLDSTGHLRVQFCKYVSLCTIKRNNRQLEIEKKNAQCQCIWTLFLFSYFFEKLLFHNIFNLTERIESRKWQYDFIVRSLKNRFWNPPFNKIHQAYLFCILLREVRFIIPACKRNLFQPSS